MNGHHVGLDHEQRNPVQGNVYQVGRKAAQKNGKSQVIEKILIAPRINGGVEILGQAGKRAHIGWGADQRVLVGSIDGRQRVHQASDIGADAEVPDAPGIDDDVEAHARTGSSFQV